MMGWLPSLKSTSSLYTAGCLSSSPPTMSALQAICRSALLLSEITYQLTTKKKNAPRAWKEENHILGAQKRYYLEETAGEERILKGPKLPVVFLWRELVADSIQDCWLLQRHVWIQCRAGGDERFEGVGKCTNQVRGEGVPKHVRYLNISNDCILATRCYSYQDLGGSCHASSGRDHNVESHVAHNRPVGVQQQSW